MITYCARDRRLQPERIIFPLLFAGSRSASTYRCLPVARHLRSPPAMGIKCDIANCARDVDKFRVSEGALVPIVSTTTCDPLGESCATPTPPHLVVVMVHRGNRPGPPCASSSARLRPRGCSEASAIDVKLRESYASRSIGRRARRDV